MISSRGRVTKAPCGSRWEERCASCSETYAKRSHLCIASGMKDLEQGAFLFLLTLTAPSFGHVHTPAWKPGQPKPKLNKHLVRCRCRVWHNPETREAKRVLGAPIDYKSYDYRGAALWNQAAGRLFSSLMRKLRHKLEGLATIQYTRVQEPQRRGLTHFHTVLVVTPTANLTRAQFVKLFAELYEKTPTALNLEAEPITFGKYDLRPIIATTACEFGGVARYLSKYLTKATGGTDSVDKLVAGSPAQAHIYAMRKEALTVAAHAKFVRMGEKHSIEDTALEVEDVYNGDTETTFLTFVIRNGLGRPGDLTRGVNGLGYSGPPRSASAKYGISLRSLKEEAKMRAQQMRAQILGVTLEELQAEADTWEYSRAATMALREGGVEKLAECLKAIHIPGITLQT